ncbi:hypothetical protein M408DRAFT_265524 [Serendipita vermifera MAFF 305830]|uniref:Uncharacterized protein n=1 Tax=Serendipita vermifera MAFF 305830 TaxID=933852 RepID=A0A0C2W9T5_SERVB|nr:hypothetical protein M408DRAFT_265524 [Serendipita vermifera MAFF 305830]
MDMPDGNGGQRRTDIPENSWGLVRDSISQVFVKLSTYNPTESDSPPTRNAPPPSASAKPTSSKKRKTKENASDDDEIMAVPDAKPIQRKRKRSINESSFQRAKNVKKDAGVRFQNLGKSSRPRVRGPHLTCNQCKYFKTTCVMGSANAQICRPCVEKGIIYCSLKPGDVGAMEKQCRSQAKDHLDASSSSSSSNSDGTDTSDESSSD